MQYLICLDTNVIYQFSLREERVRTLRSEYEAIKKYQSVLTKWAYILFTDNRLVISPLTLWEYFSNRYRGTYNYETAKRAMEAMKNRFYSKSTLDQTTWSIAVLFAAATGIPCDDAYHFIYAIRSCSNYFATEDETHFLRLQSYDKTKIIDRMKDILRDHKPIAGLFSSWNLERELQRLALLQWPNIIIDPADIPDC